MKENEDSALYVRNLFLTVADMHTKCVVIRQKRQILKKTFFERDHASFFYFESLSLKNRWCQKNLLASKKVCFCLIYFKYFGTWLARAAVFFSAKINNEQTLLQYVLSAEQTLTSEIINFSWSTISQFARCIFSPEIGGKWEFSVTKIRL